MRLALAIVLLLLGGGSAQAGENCVSKFECVDTCGWQDSPPDLHTPMILYRLFYEPAGNWGGWANHSDPLISCEKAYALYAWPRCGNAKYISKNISADCYECETPYTQNGQKNCCKTICPAETSQATHKNLHEK